MSAEEVEKLVKFLKQMEIIAKTSTNSTQVERVKKDIARYRQKLGELVPDYRLGKISLDQLSKQGSLGPSESISTASSQTSSEPVSGNSRSSVADLIPDERASPHCTDPDVNFAAAVIRIVLREYWPAVTEQHVRMDFTSGQERQALRFKIDNVVRSLKTLTETMEEYATAEKADFREQLFKMKNKQSRLFLFESNDVFRELKSFLGKHIEELERDGTAIKNPNDLIKFDRNYEDASWLENKSVRDAIYDFYNLVDYSIKKLNLPSLKPNN
ncbi:MAG: hypothetical protein H3C43_07665 [Leptonema sp. (in: Bacteria)]|nr:hypothetical protein [Leptonema sp. (in: bacteria)]